MLDYELNNKILKLAPKFIAKDIAPHSFETLKSNSTAGLVVWAGASDQTIYGDSKVNHAFRAWHDSLHIKLNAPFTLEGERLVGLEQARILKSDLQGQIIVAEVVGQIEYYSGYSLFPIDQVKFIKNYLKGLI